MLREKVSCEIKRTFRTEVNRKLSVIGGKWSVEETKNWLSLASESCFRKKKIAKFLRESTLLGSSGKNVYEIDSRSHQKRGRKSACKIIIDFLCCCDSWPWFPPPLFHVVRGRKLVILAHGLSIVCRRIRKGFFSFFINGPRVFTLFCHEMGVYVPVLRICDLFLREYFEKKNCLEPVSRPNYSTFSYCLFDYCVIQKLLGTYSRNYYSSYYKRISNPCMPLSPPPHSFAWTKTPLNR